MQAELFSNTAHHLPMVDADVNYTPGFIADHQACYQQLHEQLQWQQDTIKVYGRAVKIPRLNAWYGDADAYYSYSGLGLSPKPWTPLLLKLKRQLKDFLDVDFNSVLANHYRDGNDSVAWHSDDEQELGREPIIASLSFGASRRFSLRHRQHQAESVHMDLSGGSLLLMAGATQRHWQHQLAKTKQPVSGRINLTFRQIIVK
ncbi:MAG: alkylated DNA repair dioxygenase AlkB [Oceanicoccus sp.]|jgi:alkylated DNA repair dioxygenase AlkB